MYYGNQTWDGSAISRAEEYSGTLPGVKPTGEQQSIEIILPDSDVRVWSLFSRSAEGLESKGSNPLTIAPPPRDRIGTITAKAYSIFQSSWIPPDLVELTIEAVIADSDGVDSVWADSDLGNLGELLLTRDEVTWSAQIVEHQLPTGVLERFIGHGIHIHYLDNKGFVAESSPVFLSRVIFIPPIAISPSDTVVPAHPRLTWYPYHAEYLFTFGVDIVFISTPSYVQTPIYKKYGIDSDSSGHTVEDSLIARQGFYIWMLSIQDEFGNQAFTVEYKFTVENGG